MNRTTITIFAKNIHLIAWLIDLTDKANISLVTDNLTSKSCLVMKTGKILNGNCTKVLKLHFTKITQHTQKEAY